LLTGAGNLTEKAYVLFNNCADGQAPINARQMHDLIKGMGSKAEIVEPFTNTADNGGQPSLFE
jgi:uncharacterized protein YecE (DUF72 family)